MKRSALIRYFIVLTLVGGSMANADEPNGGTRIYENRLPPIDDPRPLLADHPESVEPIRETARFVTPARP